VINVGVGVNKCNETSTKEMTKAERKKCKDDDRFYIEFEDECRIQIAEAKWDKAHLSISSDKIIEFIDVAGRLWRSTEPYTIVVTKEINSDDPLPKSEGKYPHLDREGNCKHPKSQHYHPNLDKFEFKCGVCGYEKPKA
jgi:hypothetical protein